MTLAGIAFVIGVLGFQTLPQLPPPAWMAPTAIAALVALSHRRTRWLALVVLGLGWAWWHATQQAGDQLAPELEMRDLVVDGVIDSLPAVGERITRFELAVDRAVDPPDVALPERLRLSWYEQAPVLRPGERWRLTVRLKRPHGTLNPGVFDYERVLFQRRLGATGYVRTDPGNRRLGLELLTGRIDRYRWSLRERLLQAGDLGNALGLILALTLGDRSLIEADQRRVLLRTGTAHLLAISGLHIGLLAGIAFVLGRWLWARSARLAMRLPAQSAAGIAALGVAGLYAVLAGLSLPTQRAMVMLAVVIGAGLLRRPLRPLHALILALVLVLALDPLAATAGAFWLSFGAVAVIAWLILGRPPVVGRWRALLRVQLALAIGLAPLTLLLFHQVSLSGLVANLLAVPLVGFVVVPLCLTGALLAWIVPALAVPLLQLAAGILDVLTRVLGWMAQWSGAVLTQPAPPLWGTALALVGAAVLLAPRGWPHRWVGLPLLLVLLLAPRDGPGCGEAWLWVLDVGMGSASVVETCRHLLVFDSGPRWSERLDAGRAIVLPFLRERGERAIDRLIVSHGDRDHSGGTQALLEALPVASVWSGTPEQLAVEAARCRSGQAWHWDGVDFELLHPSGLGGNDNDRSCVLRVASRGASALLTGDIEARSERALLRRSHPRFATDVLVVPHHGSASSSSVGFVEAIKPRYALFSVGYLNRWHLPNPAVLTRYQERGVAIYRTDRQGALRMILGVDGPRGPWLARRQLKAYWRWRAEEH
jgi:competence protein ComEC